MLLTLSQTGKPEFGVRPPHELASPPIHSHHRYSPHQRPPDNSHTPYSTNSYSMSTSHRGLPPPSAMTLPDPHRQPQPPPPPPPPPSALQPQAHLGSMPAPPSQWTGGEDSMRHWLSTKAEEERTKQEEERRRQEEERTRQESYKLEQRLVEQNILRESMKGGVPPQMIPVIFAGIGGTNLVNASVDMLHQYAAQLQANQQQIQALDLASDQARDGRVAIPPPGPYATAQQQSSTSQIPPPPSLPSQQQPFPAYGPGKTGAVGPTSAPRSTPSTGLSRINTIDIAQSGGSHPTHSSHLSQSDQPNSSPSIYFHHWVPPATQETKGNLPPTPAGRNDPSSAHPSSTEGEFKDSPRKRKATGAHQPAPPPNQTSPSFSSQSSNRSRGNSTTHMRSRSNKSNEDLGDAAQRPPSRKDSVANKLREPAYYQDPHSRPPSHIGQR